MLTVYIVCLIVGGALVALSILGGGDADADADFDAGPDGDVAEMDGEGLAAAARFLSFRDLVFFVTFFGLTGTLLTLLAIGPLLTPVFSVAVGLGAGALVHRVMVSLARTESGELAEGSALEGTLASVIVGIDRKHQGKIAVNGGDHTFQMVACLHEQAEAKRLRVGDEVVIVRVVDGVAQVAGKSFLA